MQREFIVEVSGWPPAKGEALSMFSSKHKHSARVVSLLEHVRKEMPSWFERFDGPLGLDVMLWCPSTRERCDAFNFLGGIADVLEDKAARAGIEYLGELADVAVYKNDRQFKRITFQEVSDDEP